MKNRRKKILFVSHSADWGGAEASLFELLKGLNRDRFHPVVVLPGSGIFEKRLMARGVPTHHARLEWWVNRRRHDNQGLRFMSGLRARIDSVSRIIDLESPDLVFTNTSVVAEGAFAARLTRVPHLWHSLEIYSGNSDLWPIYSLPSFYGLMAGLSDSISGVSHAVTSEIEKFVPGVSARVIYNGLDLREVSPRPPKKALLLNDSRVEKVVAFIGNISPRKGVLTLAEAAPFILKEHPDVTFVVTGHDGGALSEMKQVLTKQGNLQSFKFFPFTEAPLDFMSVADVMVLPSTSDPLPITILEAMKLGKPMVSTFSGGPQEMIVDGTTGFLVPVGNAVALADAVGKLLENPRRAKEMGKAARRRLETRFSFRAFIDGFETLMESTIAGDKRRSRPASPSAEVLLGLLEESWPRRSAETEIARLKAEAAALNEKIKQGERLKAELTGLKEELSKIYASSSWRIGRKIVKPLARARDLIVRGTPH